MLDLTDAELLDLEDFLAAATPAPLVYVTTASGEHLLRVGDRPGLDRRLRELLHPIASYRRREDAVLHSKAVAWLAAMIAEIRRRRGTPGGPP